MIKISRNNGRGNKLVLVLPEDYRGFELRMWLNRGNNRQLFAEAKQRVLESGVPECIKVF